MRSTSRRAARTRSRACGAISTSAPPRAAAPTSSRVSLSPERTMRMGRSTPFTTRRLLHYTFATDMLIVQKYGGTSVGDVERIRNVARRALSARKAGHDVVVVVSAMAGETNRLLKLTSD